MACTNLYLDGAVSVGQSSSSDIAPGVLLLSGPAESLCVFRFWAYAARDLHSKVTLTFVNGNNGADKGWVRFEVKSASQPPSTQRPAELPRAVANVSRPSLHSADSGVITSGLGSVLRALVKIAHTINPQFGYLLLLGYKEACLKSCSHVSSWTRFCETDLPNCVTSIGQMETATRSSAVFDCLLRLEKQLGAAYDVRPYLSSHRGPARQQGEAGLQQQLQQGQMEAAGSLRDYCEHVVGLLHLDVSKRSKMLERHFLEGCLPSLVDFVAFVCCARILATVAVVRTESQVDNFAKAAMLPPRLAAWYERMHSIPQIESAQIELVRSSFVPEIEASVLEQLTTLGACPRGPGNATTNGTSAEPCDGGGSAQDASVPANHLVHASSAALASVLAKLRHSLRIDTNACMHGIQPLDWSALPPEVDPSAGGVPDQRAIRKRQQLTNLYCAVKSLVTAGSRVVDFCSGCGHVGIMLAYLLPWCEVQIVENKEQSLQAAVQRVDKLGLANVTVYQCNLNQFVGPFDVGVALHACGASTDMVLQRCISSCSAFVISPCCYGSIRETDDTVEAFCLSLPRSQSWRAAGITASDCLVLGHAADQTEFGKPHAELGKQCMVGVDWDRVSWAQEKNYQVELFTMSPATCSPKNNLLVGRPPHRHV